MDPIDYSKPRMEEKIQLLRENDLKNGFANKREINQDAFYPKSDLDYILRQLNSQRFDEPFFFDQLQAPTIATDQFPPKQTVEEVSENNNQSKLPLQPLPLQPTPKAIQTTSAPVNQATGLTSTETALLSPNEQAIRLKQRGIA